MPDLIHCNADVKEMLIEHCNQCPYEISMKKDDAPDYFYEFCIGFLMSIFAGLAFSAIKYNRFHFPRPSLDDMTGGLIVYMLPVWFLQGFIVTLILILTISWLWRMVTASRRP
jgi:hypothetical protein